MRFREPCRKREECRWYGNHSRRIPSTSQARAPWARCRRGHSRSCSTSARLRPPPRARPGRAPRTRRPGPGRPRHRSGFFEDRSSALFPSRAGRENSPIIGGHRIFCQTLRFPPAQFREICCRFRNAIDYLCRAQRSSAAEGGGVLLNPLREGPGRPARRRFDEPYRLVHTGRRWYLLAWDTEKSDWRNFRIDRLRPRVPSGPKFTARPLPDEDIVRYLSEGLTSIPYRYQGVFTLCGSVAAVIDEVPPTLGVVEPRDDHSCTVRIGSDSLDQLAVWVAAFGFEFEVHEPPELLDHLRTLTALLARAAGQNKIGPPPQACR
ncbi:WYL domain-containing protein [Pseudonocardiaceae bacterium YIM PH 21723]|nr:WYL domain-containing protein [Pseudonocardiaceae bacterium YIM PH 21723]